MKLRNIRLSLPGPARPWRAKLARGGFAPGLLFLLLMLLAPAASAVTYYSVEVVVHDESGAAMSGVTFTVDGKAVTATVNASKNYVIKNLTVSQHWIKPAKTGFGFYPGDLSVDFPTSGQTWSPNDKITFTGRGLYAIRGQVYRLTADGRKQGLRNVSVTRSGSSAAVLTDLDGNFTFPNLAPGLYTVKPSLTGAAATPLSSSVLVPTTGHTYSPDATASFQMTGIYRISGTLKSSTGALLAGATVTCAGSDGLGGTDIPYASATSDAKGAYSIAGLLPGIYTVIPVSGGKVFAPATASVKLPLATGTGAPNATANFTVSATSDATALLPLAYYHVKDSDGFHTKTGGVTMLLFEPNGVVDLYVSIVSDAMAFCGTYAYNKGKLTLKIPDLALNSTFTFDPSKSTATMPFKVFNEGSGSSTWNRKTPSALHNMVNVFRAATLGSDAFYDQAMARVLAEGQALIQLGSAVAGPAAEGDAAAPGSAAPPAATATPVKLRYVKPMKNGVRLKYDGMPEFSVILFGWSNATTKKLTTSPLAGDPRINLDILPPKYNADPLHKTALLLTPFFSNNNLAWYDNTFFKRHGSFKSDTYFHYSMEKDDNVVGMTKILTGKKFNVIQVKDNAVTIPRLIDELLKTPGFIYASTHGLDDGTIVTGVYLGDTDIDSVATLNLNMSKNIDAWCANPLYKSILQYKMAADGNLATIKTVGVPRVNMGSDARPTGLSAFVGVTPVFWEALRVIGKANFSNSLVYMAACETDASPDLREAVRARAHFGFSTEVPSELAGAIFQYLVTQLARHTRTPEECYYNILRADSTKLMVYKEDRILSTTLPVTAPPSTGLPDNTIINVKDMFRGYGVVWSNQALIPYQGNGWLTLNRADFDPGSVWWLLFAGRWGTDAQADRDAMTTQCWDVYWHRGKNAGLANSYCQNASPGHVPKPPEFSYMLYLLTALQGDDDSSITMVPRWTMDDEKK